MAPDRVGEEFEHANMPSGARTWYERALSIDPELPKALWRLSQIPRQKATSQATNPQRTQYWNRISSRSALIASQAHARAGRRTSRSASTTKHGKTTSANRDTLMSGEKPASLV